VVRHHGNYSSYLAQRGERPAIARPVETVAPQRSAPPSRAKLSYAEERERKELPDRIEAGERVIAELERQLADPELYASRGAEVATLVARLEASRAEVEQLLERWEELETRNEALARK
jgi:ATP-binding cassette subfamily F protein uup